MAFISRHVIFVNKSNVCKMYVPAARENFVVSVFKDVQIVIQSFIYHICPEKDSRCRQCHLNIHTCCYKPEDFKYLASPQKDQILNLLLVFKWRKNIAIPPKYIKDIISRHLVQKNQEVLEKSTAMGYAIYKNGKITILDIDIITEIKSRGIHRRA